MAAALFKMMTGIDFVQVPYRGDIELMTDLLGGQVQAGFTGITPSIENIKAGKLRALAVTTAERVEELPDVPTIGASVPGYEASGWSGIFTTKNTSIEIIDRLNNEIGAGLIDLKIKGQLAKLGITVIALSPVDFSKFIANETEKWAKVVKFAGTQAGLIRGEAGIFRNTRYANFGPPRTSRRGQIRTSILSCPRLCAHPSDAGDRNPNHAARSF